MTSTSDSKLTDDAFLGGKLHILQPQHGDRAGVDAVLLAASVPATHGQSVLELGCGAGTAILCLHARVPGLTLTAIELQPDYAALAQQNAARNGAALSTYTGDLRAMPPEITAHRYDHVIANPPYYQRTKGHTARDMGRDTARGGDTNLTDWVKAAAKRLAPKGFVTMIQAADRLPDVLNALPQMLGSVVVVPLSGRINRPADRVIVQARHGGRAGFRLCAPIILHQGAAHPGDKSHYTPEIEAVLRNGAKLDIQR